MKNLKDITPQSHMCWPLPGCPSVFVSDNTYVFVGKIVNAEAMGIKERVGDGESVVELPKELVEKVIFGSDE